MTAQEHDFDDFLRRALRAAAESVEPAADGLERIRGRVSARHVSPFMMLTGFLYDWFRPIPLWLGSGAAGARSALEWLRGRAARVQVPGRSGPAGDGTGQPPRSSHRTHLPPTGWRARLGPAFIRLGPAASWLKPVLAVSGAVAIVVAGVFTLGQVQQAVTPTNQVSRTSSPHHKVTVPSSEPAVVVPGGQPTYPSTPASSRGTPAASCSPSPKVKASPIAPGTTAAATPTGSVTPTPTPTDSSTPTDTPTNPSTNALPYRAGVVIHAAGAKLLSAAKQIVQAKDLAVPCSAASTSAKAAASAKAA